MKTNKDLILKGIRFLVYTVALMFTAPFVLYQAFKNQGHQLYIPVLILGCILALGAIIMGFVSVKTIVDAFFGKKEKS